MIQLSPARLLLATLFLTASIGLAQSTGLKPRAEITGGGDDTGQWYRWNVRNNTLVPITRIDFPQYAGDAFEPPPGWRYEFSPPDGQSLGTVTLTPIDDAGAIRPGVEMRFSMRVPRGGTTSGTADATVHFADGSTFVVPGVESSRPPSAAERYSTTVGFGAVFIIMLLFGVRQRKRRQEAAPTPPAE